MSKQRNIRRKRALEVEEEGDGEGGGQHVSLRDKLEATKQLQKQRTRAVGVASDSLAGAGLSASTSGLVEAAAQGDTKMMGGFLKEKLQEEVPVADLEMENYIEQQMNKRLGRAAGRTSGSDESGDDLDGPSDGDKKHQSELEDVSTWLTGIKEVPLPMPYKLKNIEETEAAKKKMLQQNRELMGSIEDDDDEEAQPEEGVRRAIYPRGFGRLSAKEQAWQQKVLSSPPRPRQQWKEKKRKGRD